MPTLFQLYLEHTITNVSINGQICSLLGRIIAIASVANVIKIVMGTNLDSGILTGVSRGASGIYWLNWLYRFRLISNCYTCEMRELMLTRHGKIIIGKLTTTDRAKPENEKYACVDT